MTGATGSLAGTFGEGVSQIQTTSNRIEWQHNVQVAKPLLLTAGYQFREQQGENFDLLNAVTTVPNKIVSSNAGFADAQLNLWDRLFRNRWYQARRVQCLRKRNNLSRDGRLSAPRDGHQATWQLWDWIPRSDDQSITFSGFWQSELATGEEQRV